MAYTKSRTSVKPDQRPENPTVANANDDAIHDLNCHLQRSVRYHRSRERFFNSWSNLFSFISLLSGSAVVVSLLSSAPSWVALTAGALVAIIQAIELIGQLAKKARDHNGFASEFSALERYMALRNELDNFDLREIKADILSIEAREPPVKRYLDLICHNQVARAIGSTDVANLRFWQRWFAQYLNGDTA